MSRIIAVVVLSLLASAPCQAFLGVGDITFDPAVHTELLTMYQQAMRLYQTTIRQLDRLNRIQSALQSAQANIHRVLNTQLVQYAQKTLTLAVPPGLSRLLRAPATILSSARRTILYYDGQLHRLARAARLRILSHGVRANVSKAASDLGVRSSGDITAQSTATLASLAAQRARQGARRAVRRAAGRHNDAHVSAETAALYGALASP